MKITKRTMWNVLLETLPEDFAVAVETPEETIEVDAAMVREFLNKEIENLNKKASAPRKPSKTARENKELAEKVLAEMEDNRLYTVSEMANGLPCLIEISATNQKVSALMSNMVKDGLVTRTYEKRVSFFCKNVKGEEEA